MTAFVIMLLINTFMFYARELKGTHACDYFILEGQKSTLGQPKCGVKMIALVNFAAGISASTLG
jgi:hypothetical protein